MDIAPSAMKHDGLLANRFHMDFLLEIQIIKADNWRYDRVSNQRELISEKSLCL
jgi:hypothetical protein